MCGVERRDTIRIEHITGITRVTQVSKNITEKRPKCSYVVRMKEEHIVIRMLVSTDCVRASCVNMFENIIYKSCEGGLHLEYNMCGVSISRWLHCLLLVFHVWT